MIFTKFSSFEDYKGLSKNLDKAIDYIINTDKSSIPVGKFEIYGEEVYAIVSEYETRPEKEGKFETHEKYIDIQCLLEGEEYILVSDKGTLLPTGYNEGIDKENYEDGKVDAQVKLSSDMALVLFPTDAHKACCMVDGERKPVKKLLLKVKIG